MSPALPKEATWYHHHFVERTSELADQNRSNFDFLLRLDPPCRNQPQSPQRFRAQSAEHCFLDPGMRERERLDLSKAPLAQGACESSASALAAAPHSSQQCQRLPPPGHQPTYAPAEAALLDSASLRPPWRDLILRFCRSRSYPRGLPAQLRIRACEGLSAPLASYATTDPSLHSRPQA